MSRSTRSTKTKARVVQHRKGTTLEMVRLCCPDGNQAALISESFGLPVLDSDGIREFHERSLIEGADTLSEGLSDKAMQIHLQRIVGSHVGSAYGAGQFYSKAVTEAKDATAKLANETRDEDIDGPVGFDSKAQRKREFAAEMGLQAHALRMRPRAPWPPTSTSSARAGSPTSVGGASTPPDLLCRCLRHRAPVRRAPKHSGFPTRSPTAQSGYLSGRHAGGSPRPRERPDKFGISVEAVESIILEFLEVLGHRNSRSAASKAHHP